MKNQAKNEKFWILGRIKEGLGHLEVGTFSKKLQRFVFGIGKMIFFFVKIAPEIFVILAGEYPDFFCLMVNVV